MGCTFNLMEYIVSRNYKLPTEKDVFEEGPWFNVYKNDKWPYTKLAKGDILYFYESKTKRIVWKAEVVNVNRYKYEDREDLPVIYKDSKDDQYFEKKEKGFAFDYEVRALGAYSPYQRKDGQMDRLGWKEVNLAVKRTWGLK